MKRLKDIMTRNVEIVRPETGLPEVANRMKRLDAGVMPVCDGRKILGMITDRDIVVRALAEHRDFGNIKARDIMTPEVFYLYENDNVKDAARIMRENKVRRLIVLDRSKNLVGIVSLGDLATETGDYALSGRTLEEVSVRGFRSGIRRWTSYRPNLGKTLLGLSLIGLGFAFYNRREELQEWVRERAA